MNESAIMAWIIIAIIGIIAIIIVKLYYKENEDEEISLMNSKTLNNLLGFEKSKLENSNTQENNPSSKTTQPKSNTSTYFSTQKQQPKSSLKKVGQHSNNSFNEVNVPKTSKSIYSVKPTTEKKSEEKINPDYYARIQASKKKDDTMTNSHDENNKINSFETKPKHELKDLFSIDELIKESKRKDQELEKESKIINTEKEDTTEIKESIKRNKTAKKESKIIDTKKEDTIKKESETTKKESETTKKESETTEKEDTIKKESETTEKEDTAETKNKESEENKDEVTLDDVLDEKVETQITEDPDIETAPLKSPTKINETYSNEENEFNELDYRKDLEKITNSIKNSKILSGVRDKLAPESHLSEGDEEPTVYDETYIRTVNYEDRTYQDYDEFEPIINETNENYQKNPEKYEDYYSEPTKEQMAREENTRKIYNMVKNTEPLDKQVETVEPNTKSRKIKESPVKNSLKVKINNENMTLHKGDEIIFNHKGETYSSKVYKIKSDELTVKYRGKQITIKPQDIKKIY